MGRRLKLDWQESVEELEGLYRGEKHYQRRERLLTLWHLRQGKQIKEVSHMTGRDARRIREWVAWYRAGGLSEVLKRVTGHGTTGVCPYLSPLQQQALVARVQLGDFRTIWDVMAWVEARWGIRYSYEGMRSVMKGHQLVLKVRRLRADKDRLASLIAWDWITDIFNQLPQDNTGRAFT